MKRSKAGPGLQRRVVLAMLVALSTATVALAITGGAGAIVAGGGFTTDNPGFAETSPYTYGTAYTDAACLNGGAHVLPAVNCNIYQDKRDVWANGGPAPPGGNSLSDGTYFFAVLVPGGQPSPNDGGTKNLSDTNPLGGVADPFLCAGTLLSPNTLTGCGDSYTNRTFTVSGGDISSYSGSHYTDNTHSDLGLMINLMPYDTTSNPGGVYIMALCRIDTQSTFNSITKTYDPANNAVDPRSCKYDAFKVRTGAGPPPDQIQSCFSGVKYRDDDKSGNLTAGEIGLANWKVDVKDADGNLITTVTTDSDGAWSWCEPAHASATGSTTYKFQEEQQDGWKETGNTVDEGIYSDSVVSHGLSSFVYSVTVPNDSSATGDNLDFGNIPQGNIWGAKYYDANLNGQYDVGEVLISGWTLKQGTTPFTTGSPITPADGNGFAANFLRTLDPGTYMFSEVQATNSWIQTGNTADQTFKTGGATALLGPNLSPAVPAFAYRITVPNDQPSSVSKVYFGNVCLAGGGGLTMGWWSNQNGQNVMTNTTPVNDTTGGVVPLIKGMPTTLLFLRWLNLRDLNQVSNAAINGSAFDPTDYTVANPKNAPQTYGYRPWLLNANASNMAYMLSAQLSAMELNVRFGYVNPNALIYAPGTTSANSLGFATVSAVMTEANTDLASNGLTVTSNAIRSHQEALKIALDKANNNLNFLQSSPTTCPTPAFPAPQ